MDLGREIMLVECQDKLRKRVPAFSNKLSHFLIRYTIIDFYFDITNIPQINYVIKIFDVNKQLNYPDNLEQSTAPKKPPFKHSKHSRKRLKEIKNLLMDDNNIGEKQKYQESIKLFFNDQSLLNSIIDIAIREKDRVSASQTLLTGELQ